MTYWKLEFQVFLVLGPTLTLKEKGSLVIVPSSALESMNMGAIGGMTALAESQRNKSSEKNRSDKSKENRTEKQKNK